jgi:RimJ/RimL family protein N-acetyltransferase
MVTLTCLPATPQEDEFIRVLRNTLKSGFVYQEDITSEQQALYMAKYRAFYWICWAGTEPVGFIGVVEKDLRLAVAPSFQRQGVAGCMLKAVLPLFPEAEIKVKPDNIASLNFFQRHGFFPSGTDERGLIRMCLNKTTP